MYSAQVLEHFEHPRNAGIAGPPNVIAQLENPVCGDVLSLSARIVGGRIMEIRFKAKGCVPVMACGSALTEWATGRALNEARAVSKEILIQNLGGLPPASGHAAQLAIETLALLLRNAERQAK